METISVTSYFIFLTLTLFNIGSHLTSQNLWILVTAAFLSMCIADIFSGLVHWGADTWGGLHTPLVGKSFIRSFREHHVDPMQITRHDFIEANGDNCMITVPALALLSFVPILPGDNAQLFIMSFMTSLAIFVSFTNQFHKWAHMLKPPSAIAFLQDLKVILSRKNHQIHHHTPFDRYYCITTGWLNPVLGSIAFWKRAENSISYVTGANPRQDDAFWTVQK